MSKRKHDDITHNNIKKHKIEKKEVVKDICESRNKYFSRILIGIISRLLLSDLSLKRILQRLLIWKKVPLCWEDDIKIGPYSLEDRPTIDQLWDCFNRLPAGNPSIKKLCKNAIKTVYLSSFTLEESKDAIFLVDKDKNINTEIFAFHVSSGTFYEEGYRYINFLTTDGIIYYGSGTRVKNKSKLNKLPIYQRGLL